MNINVVKYGIHVVTNGTNVNKQSSTKIKRSNYAGLKAWVQMNHRIMYCNSASRGLVGTSIWSDPCSRSSNKKIIFFPRSHPQLKRFHIWLHFVYAKQVKGLKTWWCNLLFTRRKQYSCAVFPKSPYGENISICRITDHAVFVEDSHYLL